MHKYITPTPVPTGLKIRALRKKAYKTRYQLAIQLNLSVQGIARIEGGLSDISITKLLQVANIFEVDPATLLPGYYDKTGYFGESVRPFRI